MTLLLLCAYVMLAATIIDGVIIKVNEELITLRDININYHLNCLTGVWEERDIPFDRVITYIINKTLILQEARRMRMNFVKSSDIKERLTEFKKKAGVGNWEGYLNMHGISQDEVKDWIRSELIVKDFKHRRLDLLVYIDDKDVSDEIEGNIEGYKGLSPDDARERAYKVLHERQKKGLLERWIKELKEDSNIISYLDKEPWIKGGWRKGEWVNRRGSEYMKGRK